MAVESEVEVLPKKAKKQKRNKSRVAFEEEVISKEQATEVLSKLKKIDVKANKSKKNKMSKEVELESTLHDKKSTKNNEKRVEEEFTGDSENNEVIKTKKMKKKNNVKSENIMQGKKNRNKRKLEDVVDTEQGNEMDSTNKKIKTKESEEVSEQGKADETPGKTEESMRSKKKRKHQQLLEEKKKKSELVTQENVLNYLSKWKHARVQWKFEKLKQIWLSENLFDSAKVPEEFWETTVEYFSGSKGFIRNLVLREALKIVEKQDDNSEEEDLEEEYQSRLKRARNIVQTLQE